jgi:hypothetical protein
MVWVCRVYGKGAQEDEGRGQVIESGFIGFMHAVHSTALLLVS